MELTPYCPTKGAMCPRRRACVRRYRDAEAEINKHSYIDQHPVKNLLKNVVGLGFAPERTREFAENEKAVAEALLAVNCNDECILLEAIPAAAYQQRITA